jgi:hypothetical protein
MSVALLALFALLPLQWVAFPAIPFGVGSLHELAILCFTGYVLVRLRARTYAPPLRTGAAFVVANLYMLGGIAASQFYLGLTQVPAAKHLFYLVAAIAIAGFFCRAVRAPDPTVIIAARSLSVVLCVSLLLGLGVAMAVNAVNPVAVLAMTVAAGDPEIFQKELFKSAFQGFGLSEDEVAGNLRHEIFGALLLSMLISSWAMRVGPDPTRRQERLHRLSLVLGVVLLLLSMSRSVLLAAMAWPVLAALRSVRRGELSGRQLGIVCASVVAFGGVAASGLGAVIYNRFFTDTTGYQSRASNYSDAVNSVADHWLTGGYDTVGVTTHNLVLDTLLRNGIFAALPALLIVGIVAATFGWLVAGIDRLPPAMVPVTAAVGLPLVRMLTNGGGQIPPVGWVAFGFALGILAARRAASASGSPPRSEAALAGV